VWVMVEVGVRVKGESEKRTFPGGRAERGEEVGESFGESSFELAKELRVGWTEEEEEGMERRLMSGALLREEEGGGELFRDEDPPPFEPPNSFLSASRFRPVGLSSRRMVGEDCFLFFFLEVTGGYDPLGRGRSEGCVDDSPTSSSSGSSFESASSSSESTWILSVLIIDTPPPPPPDRRLGRSLSPSSRTELLSELREFTDAARDSALESCRWRRSSRSSVDSVKNFNADMISWGIAPTSSRTWLR